MSKKIIANIVGREKLLDDLIKITAKSEFIAMNSKPGQFINIKCNDGLSTILRRPISIYNVDVDKCLFEFIFQIKGKGTLYLEKLNIGDSIDIIGPLGNRFHIENKNTRAALIGGGIGVFPLYYLAKNIKGNLDVYLGYRNKSRVVLEEEFLQLKSNLYLGTDDGSYGYKGFIINLFEEKLNSYKYDIIYTCGPFLLMKKVFEIAAKNSIKCQVSMEQRMGCGIGACLVCVCKTNINDKVDYKKICKDGPVFWGNEVFWDE